MKKQHMTSINAEIIHIADKYIKKVIINARNAYFKNKSQLNKQGIIFLNIESYEDFLASNDDNFEELYCCYINENGFKIPVRNTQLAEAILCLTDKQRSIILRNIVLNIPLSKIAISLGISKRMAEKHKQKAMEILRERMKTSNEEY